MAHNVLDDICMEVWVPEVDGDFDDGVLDKPGHVYMFGYDLTAAETESFAHFLLDKAATARRVKELHAKP